MIATLRRFTLIEMLFVIVILLVLFAMILPMLSRSRERTRQGVCSGNLLQIGLAVLNYAGDFEGNLPAGPTPSPSPDFEPVGQLNYLTEGKTWNCPSRTLPVSTPANSAFMYLGSGLKDSSPTPTTDSIAHDLFDNHPANEWANVLFLDGHVEGGNPQRSTKYANVYE